MLCTSKEANPRYGILKKTKKLITNTIGNEKKRILNPHLCITAVHIKFWTALSVYGSMLIQSPSYCPKATSSTGISEAHTICLYCFIFVIDSMRISKSAPRNVKY